MKGIVMERKSVVFKFEGELEEVSVETFTQAIMGYSSLLQVTAAKVNPSTKLDVVISGTRRGCFEAQLAAVTTDLQGLVTSAIAATGGLSRVIDMVHSLLELRRFLAEGGAPSKIERGPEPERGDQQQGQDDRQQHRPECRIERRGSACG